MNYEPLGSLEPVVGNASIIPPGPSFLRDLRRQCDKTDTLLILNKVITGFRLAPGGAQDIYQVKPDPNTLG